MRFENQAFISLFQDANIKEDNFDPHVFNIVLKNLKKLNIIIDCSTNENIIQVIRDGEHDEIGAEKLRGLLKILPELDELEMLRNFDGDKSKLGNAEKFLLQLIEVPK